MDFEYQNGQSSNKLRTLLTSEGILIGPHILKGCLRLGLGLSWRWYYNEESPDKGVCVRVCV